MSTTISKFDYWIDKLPEIQDNLEPLTQLMIRTAGETNFFIRQSKNNIGLETVNSKYIHLLHSIDREPALDKLKNRVEFLKKNKREIKGLEKKYGYVDLTSEFFMNSPFKSINAEQVARIDKKNYVTLSGVGRIGAIKIVFPEGLKIKIDVGKNIDECLKKRLIAISSLYLHSNLFSNLSKYGINEKEIISKKRVNTKKCYNRNKFLKTQKKRLFSKIIPIKG
jgi:hypothetical protein